MKLPHSYDTIGNIIILNEKANKKQAKELLKSLKHIKTILKKSGIHKGKFRTQKLTFLAGEKNKETLYKESGCSFKLDVEKCYFSPRLSNERLRIAKLVKPKENILVMFSGISIYPIIIAKHSKPKSIIGIELNPAAHKYALENIQLNKLNNITLIKGDVKKIIPKLNKKFDRILMPLPKEAESFLGLTLPVSKKNTIIHFYTFSTEKNLNQEKQKLKTFYKQKKKKIKILRAAKCGQYSPYVFRYCIDFSIC